MTLRIKFFKRVDWHLHNMDKIAAAGRDDWIVCNGRIVVKPQAWARAYDRFCGDYPDCGRFVDLHYRQRLAWHDVCDEMYIEQPTFYRLKNDVVLTFAVYAAGEGLQVMVGK